VGFISRIAWYKLLKAQRDIGMDSSNVTWWYYTKTRRCYQTSDQWKRAFKAFQTRGPTHWAVIEEKKRRMVHFLRCIWKAGNAMGDCPLSTISHPGNFLLIMK
jgi:hypothetical protein